MRYRVYSALRGARAIAASERDGRPFTEFDAADDAMTWADMLRRHGRIALLVIGDDGTQLTKHEIAAALQPTG